MFMNAAEYRESLRRHSPRVFVDGARIESVADAPQLQPGINALGVSYDFALRDELAPIMRAVQASSGKTVNRMLHVDQSSADLLNKLEAVRVLCQETGCAQRYLAHDAFSAIAQSTARVDAEDGTRYGERFTAWLHDFQDKDLAVGIAMTDAKGDRSKRPHEQANVDSYVHIVERNAKGIVLSGTKAIVTGAPYMHEFLVMPCRAMGEGDAAFAVCCAVPCDADGLTIVARPAGRPGEKAALFSSKYGQSTGVLIFDRVFVAWERVFLAGEWQHSAHLTYSYATHHRHTCIAARAGFGDLLIGAGALMCEANGFDPGAEPHLREQMVQLITIVEGFYACGVAASVYAAVDEPSTVVMPDPAFSNIGKLLLANQIYEMHRIAHYVSGGLIVTLPGPGRGPQPGDRGAPRRRAARQPRRSVRQADRGGAPDRGPHRVVPGRLVLGDQPARRRLAGGDAAGDLAQLSGRRQGGTRRTFARAQCRRPARPQDHGRSPAREVLRCRLHAAFAHDHGGAAEATRRRGAPMNEKQSYAEFHRRSLDDRDGFWAEQAALVDWQRPFETVCDTSRPPFARWFVGGTTNLCHNAVDRHLAARADAAGADLRLDRDRQRARLQLRRAARRGAAHGGSAARRSASPRATAS